MDHTMDILDLGVDGGDLFIQARVSGVVPDDPLIFRFPGQALGPAGLVHDFLNDPTFTEQMLNVLARAWDERAFEVGTAYGVINVVVDIYNRLTCAVEQEAGRYYDFLGALEAMQSLLEADEGPQYFEVMDVFPAPVPNCAPSLASKQGTQFAMLQSVESSIPRLFSAGLTFFHALKGWDAFLAERDVLYRMITLVHKIPPHPNIVIPFEITTLDGLPDGLVTGVLFDAQMLSLEDTLKDAQSNSQTISVLQKAKWFSQLSTALKHAHAAGAHTLSLHPTTLRVRAVGCDLVIADWTNASGHQDTLAPEATGAWCVAGPDLLKPGHLVYTPYQGPERENIPHWPHWDVFPEWREKWPRAAEAAVVYAAGSTINLALQCEQLNQADAEQDPDADINYHALDDAEHTGRVDSGTETKQDANDGLEDRGGAAAAPVEPQYPLAWTEVIAMCMLEDPNQRMRLSDLERFWQREVARLEEGR